MQPAPVVQAVAPSTLTLPQVGSGPQDSVDEAQMSANLAPSNYPQVPTPLQSKLWQGCSHQPKLEKQQRQLQNQKMEKQTMDFHFKHPFTCLVTGHTKAGKTTFVKDLIKNVDDMTSRINAEYIVFMKNPADKLQVKVIAGGQTFPSHPLKLDLANNKYIHAYNQLFEVLDMRKDNKELLYSFGPNL
uniref:Uncharacterized protein n=1 Tax=Romanomermis culicivorax TaxID=13658 RepID=A0A915I7I7_ROMCU